MVDGDSSLKQHLESRDVATAASGHGLLLCRERHARDVGQRQLRVHPLSSSCRYDEYTDMLEQCRLNTGLLPSVSGALSVYCSFSIEV